MVERINLLLKAKNITARQFAEEIGIQPSGMSHIMSGRNNPSLDFVMKVIKRWPEVNITWLMLGQGEMYASVPLNAQGQVERAAAPIEEKKEAEQYDLFAEPEPVVQSNIPKVEPVVAEPTPRYEPLSPTHVERETVVRQPLKEPIEPTSPVRPIADATPSRMPQPAENGVEMPQSASTLAQPTQKKKKVVKMIVVYDDHSFAEYYPE